MRFCSFFFLIAGTIQAADVSASVGIGPSTSSVPLPNGNSLGLDTTPTVLFDGSKKLIGFGPASINLDLPVAFGGSANAQLSASNTGVSAYAQHLQFAITPGLKARLGLGLLTPWVSFGVGTARLSQSGAVLTLGGAGNQTGNSWRLAFSPAVGIDLKPLPFIFFRGEVRSYLFTTPDPIFVGIDPFAGNWNGNLLFLAGVGVRF